MNEENGTPTSTGEMVIETTSEETSSGSSEEVTEDQTAAELAKAKELADNYKRRAEKAEAKAKETPKQVETKESIDQNDLIFLAKADIHEDDIADVTKWARNNNIPVKDAFNQFKPILDARTEERKTASATSTGSPRGTKPVTGEDLLQKAEKGEIPTSDADITKMIQARIERRKSQQ